MGKPKLAQGYLTQKTANYHGNLQRNSLEGVCKETVW